MNLYEIVLKEKFQIHQLLYCNHHDKILYQFYVLLPGLGPKPSISGPTEGIDDNIIDDPDGLGFTCALCGKAFGIRKHHCRRHIKNSHKKTGKALDCDVCQKSYKNCDSLRHHERTSHGIYKQ